KLTHGPVSFGALVLVAYRVARLFAAVEGVDRQFLLNHPVKDASAEAVHIDPHRDTALCSVNKELEVAGSLHRVGLEEFLDAPQDAATVAVDNGLVGPHAGDVSTKPAEFDPWERALNGCPNQGRWDQGVVANLRELAQNLGCV